MAQGRGEKSVKARSAKAPARKTGAGSRAAKTPATRRGGSKTGTAKTRAGSRATTVMGMTVPKSLTDALNSLINSPRGREILASALVAAASAAAAALIKSSDSRQGAKAREVAAEAGNQVTKDLGDAAAGVVAEIVSGAARSFLPASLTGEHDKKR